MGSYFGAASMSTRYEKKNVSGEITEQNLIFNNMFVKNEIFKKGLLLNEVLFPNEENEFLNRVAKSNYKLVYTPEVYVYHPRKEALKGLQNNCLATVPEERTRLRSSLIASRYFILCRLSSFWDF